MHAAPASAEDTDWREIVGLYGLLERVTGSPMVALNRAIAAAMVDGPEAGLALLTSSTSASPATTACTATRAHLLELAGDSEAAIAEYRAAAERTNSLPERDYLTKQAARLNASGG